MFEFPPMLQAPFFRCECSAVMDVDYRQLVREAVTRSILLVDENKSIKSDPVSIRPLSLQANSATCQISRILVSRPLNSN